MPSTTYVESTKLKTITCSAEGCGILFAVPEHWYEARQKDGKGFTCPNGHPRVFRRSLECELREQIASAKAEAASNKRWLEIEERRRRDVEESLAKQKMHTLAEKSAKARLKKRIANGVCPCCQRSFENLHLHIKKQHPEFTAEE